MLAQNTSLRIRFVKNLGIDIDSLPFELFPKKTLSESINLVTESVAGFDIPVINQLTPSETLLFTAIDLKARPIYLEYQEVNNDLAEELSLVRTADDSPLVPEGIEPIKFITPDSEFLKDPIYTQITKSYSYRQFKRKNHDLFEDQDRVFRNLIILDQTMGRAKAALFLSTRIDPTWFDRADALTIEQVKDIVAFIQKESNGGKEDETDEDIEPTEKEISVSEVESPKNELKVKLKNGQDTIGS